MFEDMELIAYPGDLPPCCHTGRLRLPRPSRASLRICGGSWDGLDWDPGHNHWTVWVGVEWSDDTFTSVSDALGRHLSHDVSGREAVFEALAGHGLVLGGDGVAVVGYQNVMTARLDDTMGAAAGRGLLQDGADLRGAADAAAEDLIDLVDQLVSHGEDRGVVFEAAPVVANAESCRSMLLLRGVRITPVMWGHGLGAWGAAQSIALLDDASTLVAPKAAPLLRRDAAAELSDADGELTPSQSRRWKSEHRRLARHWQTQLGLQPMPSHPSVLTWPIMRINDTIDSTLRAYASELAETPGDGGIRGCRPFCVHGELVSVVDGRDKGLVRQRTFGPFGLWARGTASRRLQGAATRAGC